MRLYLAILFIMFSGFRGYAEPAGQDHVNDCRIASEQSPAFLSASEDLLGCPDENDGNPELLAEFGNTSAEILCYLGSRQQEACYLRTPYVSGTLLPSTIDLPPPAAYTA